MSEPKRNRLPRFRRSPKIGNLRLTERDLEIVGLVARHRFLRSDHITSLVQGSPQHVLRRLQLLYHHDCLERVEVRQRLHRMGGSEPMVYGLGNHGALLLKQESPALFDRYEWLVKHHEKNESTEHALMISDFMVRLTRSCQGREGVDLVEPHVLSEVVFGKPKPFVWSVPVVRDSETVRLVIKPDEAFALRFPGVSESRRQFKFFFLEADRGTMPIKRKSLRQTSLYKKLVAYHHSWKQDKLKQYFKFPNFRVIFLTRSRSRLDTLLEENRKFQNGWGSGTFLFLDESAYDKYDDLLTTPLKSGAGGVETTLMA